MPHCIILVNLPLYFIFYSNPTIDGLENGLPWPKFTKPNQSMILFDSSHPSLIKNPCTDAYAFWKKLI